MNPCVVVANSAGNIRPEDVIKGILEVDELPEPLIVLPEVRGYSWAVKTKYYEAEVCVCSLEEKSIGNQEFADATNAFILPFDSSLRDGLNVAEQWLAFIEELDPEIKVLLCNDCVVEDFGMEVNHNVITKLQAQNWCVKHGFELVELNPVTIDEDSDIEDDFPESTGILRVIQALHAHVWPNLVMKGDGQQIPPIASLQHALNGLPTPLDASIAEVKVNGDCIHSSGSGSNPYRTKLVAEIKPIPKEKNSVTPNNVAVVNPTPAVEKDGARQGPSSSCENSASNVNLSADRRPSPTRDGRLDAMFQAMESMPEASFEELFHNLNEMKNKAENLSPSQRKAYAENVAIAFWKSVSGGTDSEIEGISSDENE